MTDEIQRTPPQSVDAEQALLGACLLDKEAAEGVLEYVSVDDFYGEKHRQIFECIGKLVAEGTPCDMVTVVDILKAGGDLERAGGVAYIASLTNAVPSASSAVYYAKIVAEKARIRSLIAVASRIVSSGYQGECSAEELLNQAEKEIYDIASGRVHQGFYQIGELLPDVFEMMGKIKATDGITGVPTFRDLDKLLSGLQKSDLILLAARPAVGKSSMALNIAQHAAVKHGKTVAVFSLEMPKEQLVQRMLCTEAKVNQSKVRAGIASEEDFRKMSKVITALAQANIYLDDTAGITVTEMRTKCRKLKMEKKALDLVVVDYIQLMQSANRRVENRQQEVAQISSALKVMAKELDTPVLALSQLSRAVERTNEPPNLSHLRESGALEQDADVVVFLHRPKEKEDGVDGLVQVFVSKHRNGPTGMVNLAFIPEYTMFENAAFEWVGDMPTQQ